MNEIAQRRDKEREKGTWIVGAAKNTHRKWQAALHSCLVYNVHDNHTWNYFLQRSNQWTQKKDSHAYKTTHKKQMRAEVVRPVEKHDRTYKSVTISHLY